MKHPFSIAEDNEEYQCTWCQNIFESKEEGEIIFVQQTCQILCGNCLTKYIEQIIELYEKENT